MSRSYRKPYATEGYGNSWRKSAKRQAAKTVRRFKGFLSSGGFFKKLFNSWDICDYKWEVTGECRDKYKRK